MKSTQVLYVEVVAQTRQEAWEKETQSFTEIAERNYDIYVCVCDAYEL